MEHMELQLRPIGRHVPAFQHGKYDPHSATTGGALLHFQAVTTGPLSPVDLLHYRANNQHHESASS